MTNLAQPAPSLQSVAPQPALTSFRLKRTGIRPKTFEGTELCSAMSHETGTPFWYEVNIYRAKAGDYVVEVKFFNKKDGGRDCFKTFDAIDIEDLTDRLERYDPAEDIDPEMWDIAIDGTSSAKIAIDAARLAMLTKEAKRQWNDLVGEILYEVSQG